MKFARNVLKRPGLRTIFLCKCFTTNANLNAEPNTLHVSVCSVVMSVVSVVAPVVDTFCTFSTVLMPFYMTVDHVVIIYYAFFIFMCICNKFINEQAWLIAMVLCSRKYSINMAVVSTDRSVLRLYRGNFHDEWMTKLTVSYFKVCFRGEHITGQWNLKCYILLLILITIILLLYFTIFILFVMNIY